MTSVAPHPVGTAPLVHFDHHSVEYRDHWQVICDQNLASGPVARVPEYGGFWLVSSYEAVSEVIHDDATYSSWHDMTGASGGGYEGVLIPPAVYSSLPLELDPPESLELRRVLAPAFCPHEVEALEPFIRDVASACLDKHCANGRIDLVLDFANPVPAIITTRLLGLPLGRWTALATASHEISYRVPGSPEYEQTLGSIQQMLGLLMQAIEQRRAADGAEAGRGADLISRLVGSGHDDTTVLNTVTLILAGVDTVTALTANALHWLYRHPDHRRLLIAEPALIPSATEEFLRFFTPLQALARTVTRETSLCGQRLHPGDRVLLSFAAANRDRSVFASPGEVRLDRRPNRHAAFGFGFHHCLGADLARLQFAVMLGAVLERMPDYAVDPASAERYPSIGIANGYVAMPATFAPSAPRGASLEL
jgi:cytochrome P450